MNCSLLLSTRVTSPLSIQEPALEPCRLPPLLCRSIPSLMAAPDAGPVVTARDGGHPNQSRGQVEVRFLVSQGYSPSRSGYLHPSPSPAACKRRVLGVRPHSADRRRGYGGDTDGQGQPGQTPESSRQL